MLCPLCRTRKAKRACPALNQSICAVCCGTKRLTEISCPSTCSYLSASRSHPPAVVQRRREKDWRFLLPLLANLTERQSQLLLIFQQLIVEHATSAVPALIDSDVAEGTAAAAATLETAGKGIIYQHQAASLPAQRLVSRLEAALKEMTHQAGSAAAAIERDAAIALRQISKAAHEARKGLPGDEEPVYLKLLGRWMRGGAGVGFETVDENEPGPAEGGGNLIIPG
jgi:hypothetical protein